MSISRCKLKGLVDYNLLFLSSLTIPLQFYIQMMNHCDNVCSKLSDQMNPADRNGLKGFNSVFTQVQKAQREEA